MTIRPAAPRQAQTFRCQKNWRSLIPARTPPFTMVAAASHREGKYGMAMAATGELPSPSITIRNQLATRPAACISGQPTSAAGIPSSAPPPPVIITAGNNGSTSAFASGATSEI